MKHSAVLAVLMLGALLLGAAYLASPYYAVHAIKSAAQEKDFIALHEYVDYPAVRESLRDQVLTLLATEVLRKGASNSPVAVDDSATVSVIIAQFLEGFIQPDSMISALLERGNVQEPKPGSLAASKSKHNRSIRSPASDSGRNNDDRRNA